MSRTKAAALWAAALFYLFSFEWQSDVTQERLCLFFIPCSRRDRDGNAEDVFGIFVGSFGEHSMLSDADRDVAHFVDRLRGDAAKIFDARQDDVNQLIEKRLHACA